MVPRKAHLLHLDMYSYKSLSAYISTSIYQEALVSPGAIMSQLQSLYSTWEIEPSTPSAQTWITYTSHIYKGWGRIQPLVYEQLSIPV